MPRASNILWLFFLLMEHCLWGAVRHIQVPQGGISPDAMVDSHGEIYLVFGKNQDAFLAASKDNGQSFSKPAQLNSTPHSVLVGHERGPKLALGKGGALHIVWMNTRSDGLMYTRGVPDKVPFTKPRNLLDAQTHLDGATVAANAAGEVLVAWLDARLPEDSANPVSLPLFITESRDNGATFGKNQAVESRQLLRACSCCALRAMTEPDGNLEVGFRGAYKNIRDLFLLRVALANPAPKFAVTKIHDDEWEYNACPMAGPSLSAGMKPGELWAAWMSRRKVYYAESSDGGARFAPPQGPPAGKDEPENHPLVLVNRRGNVFLAWEESGGIRWQITDQAGKVLDSGNAGTLPEKSKATGIVDRNNDFCLVF